MIADRPPRATSDAIPFWEGCDRGELLVQHCASCGDWSWFPRTYCRTCSSSDLRWEPATGRGTIETYSVVYRPMNPSFEDEVPYTLALVRIPEGPMFLTRIVGAGALEPTIGAEVEASFLATRGHSLPVFRLVD